MMNRYLGLSTRVYVSTRSYARPSLLNAAKARREASSHDPNSQYKMPVLDKAAQDMFMTEILRTMWVVLEQMFKPPHTIMYPFEKGPLSPRFRGEHALRRYPTGILKNHSIV